MTSQSSDDGITTDEPASAATPRVLAGRYELQRRLGRGGSGRVHRGWDHRLHRPVVVTLFDRGATPRDRRRQDRELRGLARLRHPGLVELHDAGTDHDQGFYVSELVNGPSLAEVVADGPVDAATTVALGADLADALATVHAADMAHRALEPDDVLVDEQGHPRLCDVGRARLEDSHDEGPAADVLSLGLVLLAAFTGEQPHETGTASGRPPHAPDILEGLSEDAATLLAAMTADDPAERPSAEEVASGLRAVAERSDPDVATGPLATGPLATGPLGGVTAPGTVRLPAPAALSGSVGEASGRPAARRRRRAALLAAASALVVVTGGAVGISAMADGEQVRATTPPRASAVPSPERDAPALPGAERAAPGDLDRTIDAFPARSGRTGAVSGLSGLSGAPGTSASPPATATSASPPAPATTSMPAPVPSAAPSSSPTARPSPTPGPTPGPGGTTSTPTTDATPTPAADDGPADDGAAEPGDGTAAPDGGAALPGGGDSTAGDAADDPTPTAAPARERTAGV